MTYELDTISGKTIIKYHVPLEIIDDLVKDASENFPDAQFVIIGYSDDSEYGTIMFRTTTETDYHEMVLYYIKGFVAHYLLIKKKKEDIYV